MSDLLQRLEGLLKELDPWEMKLQQANKKARMKMLKELETYTEEPEAAVSYLLIHEIMLCSA